MTKEMILVKKADLIKQYLSVAYMCMHIEQTKTDKETKKIANEVAGACTLFLDMYQISKDEVLGAIKELKEHSDENNKQS